MGRLFLSADMVRLYEGNDWVMFILLGSIFVYISLFSFLRVTIWEFLWKEMVISGNNLLSWVVNSIVFSVLLSALVSQYVPILPKLVEEREIFGLTLNKFGYSFVILCLYYLVRIVFTYFYFQCVGASKQWAMFYFSANKFYFIGAMLLMIMCFVHYYFPIDTVVVFPFYGVGFLLFVCAKNVYYLFQRPSILPKEWFYKFLYICTLQIAPILAVLKLLFIIR